MSLIIIYLASLSLLSLVYSFLFRLWKKHLSGYECFINSGCRFQDQGGIPIGHGVLVGNNVVLATINHDINPRKRSTIYPAPIVIGQNVWIGANATVIPVVTIGDGTIIANLLLFIKYKMKLLLSQ
jgi:acetyltransferase-like isoleucine patch superfamily enzyme